MTGVHRGASQDVPLAVVFFCGRCGARRAKLWSSGAGAWSLREAALLHLHKGCNVVLSLRTLELVVALVAVVKGAAKKG